MDDRAKRAVIECTEASDEERTTFGDVVGLLIAAGVERYHADLVCSNKTYYMPNGDVEIVPSTLTRSSAADTFSDEGIEAAIRAIQARQIGYREFCARITVAGCVGYHVFLAGRRAIYYGRSGDFHVELFPPAN